MSNPIPPEKIPAEALRGMRFITSRSAASMPRAKAGRLSVIMLIQSRWTGCRITKPISVAVKMLSTSLMLEPSRNWMALRMLS